MSYSVLPALAGREQLERANAVYQVGIQASTALGPLTSGAILLEASLGQVLGTFSALLLAVTIWGYLKIHTESDTGPATFVFTLWDPSVLPVLWIVLTSFGMNLLLYGPLQVGMSTWIEFHHWPVSLLGVVLAAFGAGGVAGALLQGLLLHLRSPFVTWSPAVLPALAWLALWPVLDEDWALPPVVFVVGIMTGWVTTIMLRSAYRLVSSSDLTAVFSLIFFGSALGQVISLNGTGLVLSHTGLPRLVVGAGGGLLCVGIVTFIFGVRMNLPRVKSDLREGVHGP